MNIQQKQKLDLILGSLSLAILRLPVILLGRILKRNHSPQPNGDIMFIKMVGGGSLIIAYPAILGIRKRYEDRRILLLTTDALKHFAASMNVFDEIICIRDTNISSIFISTFFALLRCIGKVDTVIDLEVYSRLTAVFSVFTAARNRIGFYLESTYWRRNIYTHLIFFNRFTGNYFFYEEMAKLLNATPVDRRICEEHFRKKLPSIAKKIGQGHIAIGHACSDLGTERMLSPEQWVDVLHRKGIIDGKFIFLGSKKDSEPANKIIKQLMMHFPNATFENKCGSLSLLESISYIDSSVEFWGIDSALLHYARLLGKKRCLSGGQLIRPPV